MNRVYLGFIIDCKPQLQWIKCGGIGGGRPTCIGEGSLVDGRPQACVYRVSIKYRSVCHIEDLGPRTSLIYSQSSSVASV